MKRFFAFLLAFCCAFLLAGCGKHISDSSPHKNYEYASILRAARSSEDKIPIITNPKQDKFGLLELYDLSEDAMQEYAVSFSATNDKAYGIAIVLPKEGKTDTITQKLTAMIESCQNAFRNYLPKEYEIAKAAKLEVLESGEVVLAMCENDDLVFDNIVSALKEKAAL